MPSRPFSILVVFLTVVAIYSIRSVSSRDPTSLFFSPRAGYAPAYSTIRKEQAEGFISAVSNATRHVAPKSNKEVKKLCVGIPSIARKGARYLRTAVGSLLEGLTPEERDEIALIVFIPHSDPTIHPAYTEQWLPELADEVLVYDVSEDQMKHIKEMEQEGGLYREKGLYDYSYLVKACHKTQAPYIAMLEDDTVAMDGWFHRTMAGIEKAETLSALKKASPDFLYLRLFYTEEFLGWNSEDWRTYVLCSTMFVAVPVAALALLRGTFPSAKKLVSTRTMLLSMSISTALILVFFSLGRVTVLPLAAGVNEMPKYGCCSQGFVFPREKALTLVNFLEEKKLGFVDVLTEEYADANGELRWAITPSVIQHVGRRSSKVDDYGPMSKHGLSVAEKIWNFAFERYDAEQLRQEHWYATHRGNKR
ncbi:integral membrane protein-like protein [Lophiostoma macrostomum CBS 122681]|uniref:Integral membrane protein-like protein n=1 Tax=Lophiostoma macrostomum CBS 122681 TaxID=1314788 RepID=A0A6A6TMB9_9PLEO|nr:integral membrane protein-like protein [Lophiostoma macrostomum CBS 122681]